MEKDKSSRQPEITFASMKRALQRKNCLPVRRPLLEGLLDPEEMADLSEETRELEFRRWEQYRADLMKLEQENLKSAVVRISLCAFLKGLTTPFTLHKPIKLKHYSWCVKHEWETLLKMNDSDI